MNDLMNSNWSVQVMGMVAIAAAGTAVFWAAEGIESAWPFALAMAAFIAVVHFGRRRFNTLEVMSGTGDERLRSLYTQAVAYAGTGGRAEQRAERPVRDLRADVRRGDIRTRAPQLEPRPGQAKAQPDISGGPGREPPAAIHQLLRITQ